MGSATSLVFSFSLLFLALAFFYLFPSSLLPSFILSCFLFLSGHVSLTVTSTYETGTDNLITENKGLEIAVESRKIGS